MIANQAEIISTSIKSEMERSYIDYAMSVIVSRALPDVRDGLKPVHRRILFSMQDTGCHYNRPYRKSARIVGDVMGKYHPHGDSAIYDALVRMAQDFSLLVPLIDGQGNFGSLDGDSAAAMRYTESRMAKIASSLMADIDYNTVEFQDNYDGSEREPTVLPARFPNLLVNGSGGIAVGMATNIPSHNLGEVIDACCLLIDNPKANLADIMQVMPGPDFPTGGMILGRGGISKAFATGKGSITMRGVVNYVENKSGPNQLIISEIPYQINKARLVEKITDLLKDKKIEGVADIRDESDKVGIRIVLDLKRDGMPEVIENQLYSYTQLQSNFGINMVALSNKLPKLMNVYDVLSEFIAFRKEVVTNRTLHLLTKARVKAHINAGLAIAVNNIDEVIKLIKSSANTEEAKQRLLARDWDATDILPILKLVADFEDNANTSIKLSEDQVKAILEMRLQRLTGLEMQKIHEDLKALAIEIAGYLEILNSTQKLVALVREELVEVKTQYAKPRKTRIEEFEFEQDIEALIPSEDMVVTVTVGGYIKRVPLKTYRAQNRGGKGRSGVNMHNEDITSQVIISNTHHNLLCFTSFGKVFRIKTHTLPLGSPTARGRSLRNILNISDHECVESIVSISSDQRENNDYQNIVFATASGNIRRNNVADFASINTSGKIAMKLDDGDRLIGVALCRDSDDILLAADSGKAIRFNVKAVRVFKGRVSSGVRALRLDKGGKLISLSIINGSIDAMSKREQYLKIALEDRLKLQQQPDHINSIKLPEGGNLQPQEVVELAQQEQFILTITENGYGKRTSSYEYRTTNRGGVGIANIITSSRNGRVVSSFNAGNDSEVMLITNQGKLIRISVAQISVIGRNTQGVMMFRTEKNEKVVSAAKIDTDAAATADDSEDSVAE
ncbi:MAG: DNA gyrase subunit A [Pseudomonadota bacterium]